MYEYVNDLPDFLKEREKFHVIYIYIFIYLFIEINLHSLTASQIVIPVFGGLMLICLYRRCTNSRKRSDIAEPTLRISLRFIEETRLLLVTARGSVLHFSLMHQVNSRQHVISNIWSIRKHWDLSNAKVP
jgi:hypothetical protein